MSREIDYRSIDIPEAKPPTEYTYAERRAELLREIEDVGHPKLLNQSELADRYGCTRPNIHNDLDVLAEYVDTQLGARRQLTTTAVLDRCVTGLLEEGEYRKAARTMLDYNEWVDEYQDREEFADRLAEIEARLADSEGPSPVSPASDSIAADGGGADVTIQHD